MWLLDANLDLRISELLGEFGIKSHTAENRGRKQLLNGELVSAAVAAGVTGLLTRDRLFAESASRALKQHPRLDPARKTKKVSVSSAIPLGHLAKPDRAGVL